MTNLYNEILEYESTLESPLSQEEYYSIPFTSSELKVMLNTLSENGHTDLVNNIQTFLNEEYNIDYIPHYFIEK